MAICISLSCRCPMEDNIEGTALCHQVKCEHPLPSQSGPCLLGLHRAHVHSETLPCGVRDLSSSLVK